MIERTNDQPRALGEAGPQPATVIDPTTRTAYVLLRREVYEHLTCEEYDSSPWTAGEMDTLAAQVDAMLEDGMAIQDRTAL